MNPIRKVPASAGAEWLLGGFGLLRRAPLALGLLGVIWGGLSALGTATEQVWINILVSVFGPILFGGLVYAAREVDAGRSAAPAHLLQGAREGKTARLLATLLPQIGAALLLAMLLVVLVGQEQLEALVRVAERLQQNPDAGTDPELVRQIPAGRIMLWLAAALIVGAVAGLFTFLAIPEVMFTSRGGLAALGLSFRACLRNLPALVVLVVLLFITLFAISLAANVVAVILGFLIGQAAAMALGQVLMMAVLLPVMAGAVYHAWRAVLGERDGAAPPPLPAAGIEA